MTVVHKGLTTLPTELQHYALRVVPQGKDPEYKWVFCSSLQVLFFKADLCVSNLEMRQMKFTVIFVPSPSGMLGQGISSVQS